MIPVLAVVVVLNLVVVILALRRFKESRRPIYAAIVAGFSAPVVVNVAALAYAGASFYSMNAYSNSDVSIHHIYSKLFAAEPYYVAGAIIIGTIFDIRAHTS